MSQNNTSSTGIGFFGLLGIVFITLKLTNIINWSWWLVLLPLYGGFILVVAIVILYVLAASWSKG